MRALVVLCLAGLSGCLFVGQVNDDPSALIVTNPSTAAIGQPIDITVALSDDQPGVKALPLVVLDDTGADATGETFPNVPDMGSPTCPKVTVTTTDTGYQLTFFAAGTYTVIASAQDSDGAPSCKGCSDSTAVITAFDATPTFPPGEDQLHEGSATNSCGSYNAASPLSIVADSDATDPEATSPGYAICAAIAPPLVHHFTLVTQPTGTGRLGRADTMGACPATPVDPGTTLDTDLDPTKYSVRAVCLYPDTTIPASTPSMYGVQLSVDDGVAQNTTTTQVLNVAVVGDAPACLDGEYPSPGSYTLDRDATTVFEVVGIDDTTSASALEYTWTLDRDGTTTTLVASSSASDGGARFSLDGSAYGFAVGETATLRVEVAQPDAAPSGCADSDDTCVVASCVARPATTCPRRATWALELR